MVNFEYYNPTEIFTKNSNGNSNPEGMTGDMNFALAKSFLRSRDGDHMTHNCNNRNTGNDRHNQFDRNAGAVALFIRDLSGNINQFHIPGRDNQDYHFISHGNKYFKKLTSKMPSAYGHSEKILMRDILDDLISADPNKHQTVSKPSSHCKSHQSEIEQQYNILLALIDNAPHYKKYLTEKNIFVKMWSERPACTDVPNKTIEGMKCKKFLENICPEGSQFGCIVKEYKPPTDSDNKEEEQIMALNAVKEAFNAFRKSYSDHQENQSIVAHHDYSSSDNPIVDGACHSRN